VHNRRYRKITRGVRDRRQFAPPGAGVHLRNVAKTQADRVDLGLRAAKRRRPSRVMAAVLIHMAPSVALLRCTVRFRMTISAEGHRRGIFAGHPGGCLITVPPHIPASVICAHPRLEGLRLLSGKRRPAGSACSGSSAANRSCTTSRDAGRDCFTPIRQRVSGVRVAPTPLRRHQVPRQC